MQSTKIFWENPLFSAKTNKPRGNFPEVGKPLGLGSKPRIIVGSLRRQGGFVEPGARVAKPRNSRVQLLPPQSPRGFSALARLYYLARPTKTAMLHSLPGYIFVIAHICRRHLRPKLLIARKCDGVFKKTQPQQTLNSLFSCLGSSVKDT